MAAWVGVGRRARARLLRPGEAWSLLVVWALPLFLGPPLFSRDLYSYVAQGTLAHVGLDPYSVGPSALGPGHLLTSVAPTWRHTAAPYGPLFLGVSRWLAGASGSSVAAGVMAQRVLELAGLAAMAWAVPRLARHLGADPGAALWLGVLSPLSLLSLVASGHNDALMLGLLTAGLVLVVEDRVGAGLALCALAATVKLPAALAVLFVGAWELGGRRGRERTLALARVVVVPLATVVVVTWVVGLGWGWVGPAVLRVPAESRVLPTPSVGLGAFLFHILRLPVLDLGHGPLRQTAVVSACQAVGTVLGAAGVLWLARRARGGDVVRLLGLALAVVVVTGPSLWPWYVTWPVVLLAATSAQEWRALPVVAGLGMLTVTPSGAPSLKGGAYVVVVAAVVAGTVWLVRSRRRLIPRSGSPPLGGPATGLTGAAPLADRP